MPIYLCKPGVSMPEPWRHGLQVYAQPFPMDETCTVIQQTSTDTNNNRTHNLRSALSQRNNGGRHELLNEEEDNNIGIEEKQNEIIIEHRDQKETDNERQISRSSSKQLVTFAGSVPIRRLRHAEVILVDEVILQYGRYWLKLRWPGTQGGFAGFVALRKVSEDDVVMSWMLSPETNYGVSVPPEDWRRISSLISGEDVNVRKILSLDRDTKAMSSNNFDKGEFCLPCDEGNEVQHRLTPSEIERNLIRCSSNGLYYPSSQEIELLHAYDDGISDDGKTMMRLSTTGSDDAGEPVFCRICREGLHDVSYELNESTSQTPFESANTTNRTQAATPRTRTEDEGSPPPTSNIPTHQAITSHPTAENPLLAPCKCSGSIAFVHYLCVEQWRCRSRHPAARNGLNCETCGAAYTLPPPPTRAVERPQLLDDEWLEAMPPHVLNALRRPHIWWQLGAAIVRRKWLRPIAPIVISPLVALYCRARRMLKKRGVSRRRWACSLCRRRARWKCVRCLRSYYCSRQCQNVSWHIVHKHVCYKPARFWWSVIFYSMVLFLMFPGILRDPIVYSTGIALIPLGFVIIGFIAGTLASSAKKLLRIDARGRVLESSVVICTIKIAKLNWAIVNAFFGDSSLCSNSPNPLPFSFHILPFVQSKVFQPLLFTFTTLDNLLLRSPIPFICKKNEYCFEAISNANSTPLSNAELSEECSFEITSLSFVFIFAVLVGILGLVVKKGNRDRRGGGVARDRLGRAVLVERLGGIRPHQD